MSTPAFDSLKDRFFMCRPDHFSVSYIINPWMKGNIGRTVSKKAKKQWDDLYQIMDSRTQVELIDPMPGLPDMVFTANSGIMLDNEVVLTRFSHQERRGEEALFKKWFKDKGYTVHQTPPDIFFEGAGDALLDRQGRWLWAAYGFRSSLEAHSFLAAIFNIKVISLRLTDPRFYHLDTCFLPMPDGYLMYYPEALDTRSNHEIEKIIPAEKRIIIENEDAINFAANAVCVDRTIILNICTKLLKQRLESCGFEVIETDLTEFTKAGGSAKCLTLNLIETAAKNRTSHSTVCTRKVRVEGQLIDSHLMSRIFDNIVNGGGAFQIHEMHVGQKRNEVSSAQIDVTAPNEQMLDQIVQKIIPLGACLPMGESSDVKVEPVEQDGVAPESFYSTTIYHTQIRVSEKWIDVTDQRMDAVIVISNKSARCELIRNLKVGDSVVTGGEGIRVMHPTAGYKAHEQFGFMASSISSERRVELAIEQIAWEIERIRGNGGKLVVVVGPVVIHTGAARHLSWMVSNGYVGGLLGGNAVAVHDIEQAMYGTSLGVDLKTGFSLERGHRNHIAAINAIRRAGSIQSAVEKGVLTSGLFYELVQHKVSYSLAGSIRDDGPLPETEMDLIKAQKAYSQILKGADMVLMLSSMLHSIGTGNMTPAGVKLVCVDINPAVITKLTDRGSLESVSVVTDVGLFLSQLVKRLSSPESKP